MNESICSKCGGAMEGGFLVDHAQGAVMPSEWAEGDVKYSVWTGVKMKGKKVFPVETLRCARCGYLESYARPATNAP